jgi:hypothetical protein
VSRAGSARPGPKLAVSRAITETFATGGRRLAFALLGAGISLLYSLLLPFAFTQRLEFANWDFLTGGQLAWSVVLGGAMAFVLVVQFHAMRRVASARVATGATGGVAFVVSLLPSFLCCTPFVPTLLAFLGVSGLALYSTTGAVQHVFATYQPEFLGGSLLLLLVTAAWGLHRVATAPCCADDRCARPSAPRRDEDRGARRPVAAGEGTGR